MANQITFTTQNPDPTKNTLTVTMTNTQAARVIVTPTGNNPNGSITIVETLDQCPPAPPAPPNPLPPGYYLMTPMIGNPPSTSVQLSVAGSYSVGVECAPSCGHPRKPSILMASQYNGAMHESNWTFQGSDPTQGIIIDLIDAPGGPPAAANPANAFDWLKMHAAELDQYILASSIEAVEAAMTTE